MLEKKNEQGFTLLEVAMVLIVASLIVLGVLKAQGVWDEAKSFRLERQVQELQVASALFERKMGYLPGADPDDPNEIVNDNGNDAEDWNVDLSNENLIISEAAALSHPFGGSVWLEEMGPGDVPFGYALNMFRFDNVPAAFARALDERLDDGEPDSGDIRAYDAGTTGDVNDYSDYDNVDLFILLQ